MTHGKLAKVTTHKTGDSTPTRRVSAANDQWPEQLAVRIARFYYELGMTQQQIASELGIGRARVIKLLAEARERGIVTISINSPLVENVVLADALKDKFNLSSAEVCLVQADSEQMLAQQIGSAAGDYVLTFIKDNMNLSVGWGVTLKELVSGMRKHPTNNVTVVSLLGSLIRKSTMVRFEAGTDMAERLDAECHYLPAPIVCDSESTREILESQPMFRELREMALSSDVAVVSIGGLDSATIRQVGLVSDAEFRSVKANGAIGNFLGYYIDSEGAIVDHPVNQRVIGVSGEQFNTIPKRIMISGGDNKVSALLAVLNQGWITDLATDADTARALLESA